MNTKQYNYFTGFVKGDIRTKLSYILMGFGHITRGQIAKGLIYLLLEVSFVFFMLNFGATYIYGFFRGIIGKGTLGTVETTEAWDDAQGIYVTVVGDNSFKILLYGILSILIIAFFIVVYYNSVMSAVRLKQTCDRGIKPASFVKDLKDLSNNKFHTVLLSLPMLGLFVFTVIPLITMIMVAFTNYDTAHEVPKKLFSWAGFENFVELFNGSALSSTFARVLGWTLVWAFFATFSNYFIGMILALLINKKSIRFKKVFRTIFVTTMAVPQFVTLLLMSKMLDADGGIITQLIYEITGFSMKFGQDILTTRICIILVNIWVGVPYSMLICTGILMNIPEDLYESAKIDGAGPVVTFFKITLPYMLFVTGPYLITQFVGNINNFNVIYLLSGGGPADNLLYTDNAKGTDLLITWLYGLSIGDNKNYKLASVIGILVFVICATMSLLVYNRSSAVKREDDFQ